MAAEVFSNSPLKTFGKRQNGEMAEMNQGHAFGFQMQMQKRRRLQQLNVDPTDVSDENELSRSKRSRVQDHADEHVDAPVYSQRQMQQLELSKNAEIQRLRDEMAQYVQRKDEEVRVKCAEAELVLQQAAAQKTELERLSHENGILKQGIRIQQNSVEKTRVECAQKLEEERASFTQVGVQAAEHIRRLEALNFSLRTQLEQMAPSSNSMTGTPRWGF